MENIELKLKINLETLPDLETALKKIRDIEKEYRCHCTLLEIEINTQK